jgi:hypothetical protein
MIPPPGIGAGFEDRPKPVASPKLIHAVAATLAVGSLSLCLIVALMAMSIKDRQLSLPQLAGHSSATLSHRA